MISLLDEKDQEYGVQATIKETNGVNGERKIEGKIYVDPAHIATQIDVGWRVRWNDDYFVVTYAKPEDVGNQTLCEFDAVQQFFYDMSKSILYQSESRSHPFEWWLNWVFESTGYTVKSFVSIKAFSKENFGMKNRLSLFNELIKQAGVEFTVTGKSVAIHEQVGTDLSTIVKKGFNLNELRITKNIGQFITYKKGFGAYVDDEDHSKGRLEAEYESPLAKVYGRLSGDPVEDERYTVKENLVTRLKEEVDASYTISVELTMEDLTKAGYRYKQPRAGDWIMAINDNLNFRERLRIVSFESNYDVTGVLIGHTVTCNDIGRVQRPPSPYQDLTNKVEDLNDVTIDIIKNQNYIMSSADGKNRVFYGKDFPVDEPKGTITVGDLFFRQVGEEVILYIWNGNSWEELLRTDDMEFVKREIEKIQQWWKEWEVDWEKRQAENDQKLEAFEDKLSHTLDADDLDEKLKAVGFDPKEIEKIKELAQQASANSDLSLDLIGDDGQPKYNKNRLNGDGNVVIGLHDGDKELFHNGKGFEVGKKYTISFKSPYCSILPQGTLVVHLSDNGEES